MKRSTKITVFIVTTVLTAGTLFATLGHHYCHKGGWGKDGHCKAYNYCGDEGKSNTGTTEIKTQ
ncbi:MAG: hypothetical protein AB1458_04285 [Bacteroidota bacterium]